MRCRHGDLPENWSEPECAFDEEGNFIDDNWNCLLMSKVRCLCNQWDEHNPGFNLWHEDEYMGIIRIPCIVDLADEFVDSPLAGRFAILTWYKSRGATDGFWICDGDEMRLGTEDDANEIVKLFQDYVDSQFKEKGDP